MSDVDFSDFSSSSGEDIAIEKTNIPSKNNPNMQNNNNNNNNNNDQNFQSVKIKQNNQNSDDEEEEETEHMSSGAIERAEMKLQANPYDIQAHFNLIETLKKEKAPFSKIQKARFQMSKSFQIPLDTWKEWIRHSLENIEDPEEILNFYKKIFETDLYIELSSDFLLLTEEVFWPLDPLNNDEKKKKFSENFQEEKEIEKIRENFNFISRIFGNWIPFSEEKVWSLYRKFEFKVLDTLPKNLKEKQQEIIENLYSKILSIPMENLPKVYQEYLKKCDFRKNEEKIKIKYKKSQENYEKRKKFEEKIKKLDTPDFNSLIEWNEYLDFEEKNGNRSQIISLYERAILFFSWKFPEIWIRYLRYNEKKKNQEWENVSPLYQRALKILFYSGQVWSHYLRSSYIYKQDEDFIKKIYNNAFGSGLQTPFDYLEVMISYCDILKKSNSNTLRETLKEGLSYFEKYFPESLEKFQYLRYYIRIEGYFYKDITEVRKVSESVKKKPTQIWLEYIQFERTLGEISNCRKVFQTAILGIPKNETSELLFQEWILFEREEGTLSQLNEVLDKYSKFLRDYYQRTSKRNEKKENEKKKDKTEKRRDDKNFQDKYDKHVQDKYDKHSKDKFEEINKFKKQTEVNEDEVLETERPIKKTKTEIEEPEILVQPRTLFVVGTGNSDEKEIEKLFEKYGKVEEVRLMKEKKTGESKGFGYIEFLSEKSASKALEMNNFDFNGKKLQVSIAVDKPKRTRSNDLKAFISKFSKKWTEKEIKEFLSDTSILSVRIIKERSTGESKGFGYIDFETENDLLNALKKNGTKVEGKKISIQRSDPDRKQSTAPKQRTGKEIHFKKEHDNNNNNNNNSNNKNEKSEKKPLSNKDFLNFLK